MTFFSSFARVVRMGLQPAEEAQSLTEKLCLRTVDGDGDSLVESVAISTDEGWDLAELVDL